MVKGRKGGMLRQNQAVGNGKDKCGDAPIPPSNRTTLCAREGVLFYCSFGSPIPPPPWAHHQYSAKASYTGSQGHNHKSMNGHIAPTQSLGHPVRQMSFSPAYFQAVSTFSYMKRCLPGVNNIAIKGIEGREEAFNPIFLRSFLSKEEGDATPRQTSSRLMQRSRMLSAGTHCK